MRIPSSAVMWWRAQMRARQEAAREAARPINVAHVIALVSVAALTIVALVALSPWFGGLLGGWISGVRETASLDMAAAQGALGVAGGRLDAARAHDRRLARARAGRDLFRGCG